MDRSHVTRWLEQQLSEMFNWECELQSKELASNQVSLRKLCAHRKWLADELLHLHQIAQ